jgi:Bifunctional DNA primase/polymerase, N-terminal
VQRSLPSARSAADESRLMADQTPAALASGAVTTYHASQAAACGWSVFPCRPDDKRPAVPDWEHKACADPQIVGRYWPSGLHNIGIACGPSRLVVLDLDTHAELPEPWRLPGVIDGRDVLAQLCKWAGQPWPSTHTVATPSGGWHLYFASPAGTEVRNSAGLIGPQVDVRGVGGYVVGAGSVVDGQRYEVLDDRQPVLLPGWIGRMLTRQPEPPRPPGRRATCLPAWRAWCAPWRPRRKASATMSCSGPPAVPPSWRTPT